MRYPASASTDNSSHSAKSPRGRVAHGTLGADDQRRWNGLQNTPNDIKLLTNALVRALKSLRR